MRISNNHENITEFVGSGNTLLLIPLAPRVTRFDGPPRKLGESRLLEAKLLPEVCPRLPDFLSEASGCEPPFLGRAELSPDPTGILRAEPLLLPLGAWPAEGPRLCTGDAMLLWGGVLVTWRPTNLGS